MNRLQFWILISIVAISGFSQGMLLPLISIIFEQDGISSTMNGLNATGLYIGILIISPFMEYPLRKYGYKPIILLGGLLVIVSLAFFPLYKSFWFWFFLRLCIGIGDNALHFGTQTWITSSTLKEHRGRNISLYGLFFGIGFAAGPLMTPLVTISESLPFILSACMCLISWLFLFLLKNEKPVQDDTEEVAINSFKETASRFKTTLSFCWVALLPALCYGFLEASLNGSFPIYGLRIGLDVSYISIALAAFAVGGVITQLPLGMLSDRIGRRRLLTYILFFGSLTFFAASFLESSALALTICLLFAGMLVGSTFSLGISYMTDVTPKSLLPTGNLLCGIAFSLGSLLGPYLGGVFIQVFTSISFFVVIGSILFMIFVIISTRKQEITY
ncbi:MFS transporter [Bacillus suaedae]|uniref:MFS transporter n=1 Tax=Halalkalibacter suaedae TaxID=2822140 RepID=A0A941AQ99_9BACI|nr:MFS transporter [Bacillus suaedae]MBP3952392.1 MFS transporter [Bacillus suaedae]